MNFIKPFECEKEARIIGAARTGSWDSELRQHAATCATCAEVALAAGVLNEMQAVDLVEARVPDAGLMWWKAQLLAKREAAERATQPINFIERFACAWVGLGLIGVCVWRWPVIHTWLASRAWGPIKVNVGSLESFLSHFFASVAPNWLAKSAYLRGPGLAMVFGMGILLAFVAFATYLTRSEE